MSDCISMSYPGTMEEFIEEYSFVDSKEEYTNGAKLIPVFRVKQGLEYFYKDISKLPDGFSFDFEPFCADCEDLTPDCHGITMAFATGKKEISWTLTCSNIKKCRAMKERIDNYTRRM